MKTKSALVIEWCEKNKIVDLIVPYRGDIYSYKLAEATTDEDAKLLIGGFDDEQNYHKLPDDIFKIKVTKSQRGYVSDFYLTALKSGKSYQSCFCNVYDILGSREAEAKVNIVTVSWEEEEEAK